MLTAWHARCQSVRCDLSCYHDNAYGGFNFGVQVHGHVEFANVTDSAVRQTNFAFCNFNASCSHCISNIASTDRAEQFAFVA